LAGADAVSRTICCQLTLDIFVTLLDLADDLLKYVHSSVYYENIADNTVSPI